MDKLRVLLLGVGNFGGSWAAQIIPSCDDLCEFAGACDIVEENLKKVPSGVPVYTDIDIALAEVKPDIVINVTPPDRHTPLNIHIMERGYPVICEKPVSGNIEDAEKMFAYYQEKGGYLAVLDDYRYSTVFRKAKEVLLSGNLGSIRTVNALFRHYHPDASTRYHGMLDNPLLLDVSIHHLDVCRFLTGAEPVSTYCETFGAMYSWYENRPANAVLHARMTGDIFFSYFGTLGAYAGTTRWNGNWELECDKGTLKIEDDELYIYRQHEAGAVKLYSEDNSVLSRTAMLRSVLKAFSEGRKCESDLTDNILSYRWLNDAIVSARSHTAVQRRVSHFNDK